MASLSRKTGARNKFWVVASSAAIAILQFSMGVFAHDTGISSINLNIANNELVIYSSYARADFQTLTPQNHVEELKSLAKNAVFIKVDGKPAKPIKTDAYLDDADGVIFYHSFCKLDGSKISLNSLLPLSLSPTHTQILTIASSDGKEIARQILSGDNFKFVFELDKIDAPSSFGQFLSLGIKHILLGFDHLLFLFALLLTVRTFREIAGINHFFHACTFNHIIARYAEHNSDPFDLR